MATPRLPPKGDAAGGSGTGPVGIQVQAAAAQFQLPPVELPNYTASIPVKHLQELVSNHDLIRDYVLQSNEDSLGTESQQLLAQIDANLARLKELQARLESTLLPRQDQLDARLQKLNAKFKAQWSPAELQMYSHLGKYSQQNMVKMMNSLVLESDDVTKSIYNSVLEKSHTDRLKDAEVSTFLDEYLAARQLYHTRREKLYRLKENRVSG